MAIYQLTTGGVIKAGVFIPDDDALQPWQTYQEWLNDGNTPDAAAVPVLADEQASASIRVNAKAEELLLAEVPGGEGRAVLEAHRLQEAIVADADGTITAGEYPLLEAEVGVNGVDVAAVATFVLGLRTSRIAWFAQVEAVRVATLDSIDGAADVAAVLSAESGASWPTPS